MEGLLNEILVVFADFVEYISAILASIISFILEKFTIGVIGLVVILESKDQSYISAIFLVAVVTASTVILFFLLKNRIDSAKKARKRRKNQCVSKSKKLPTKNGKVKVSRAKGGAERIKLKKNIKTPGIKV